MGLGAKTQALPWELKHALLVYWHTLAHKVTLLISVTLWYIAVVTSSILPYYPPALSLVSLDIIFSS